MLVLFIALMGLFPALFLTALQAMLLLMLLWLLWNVRSITPAALKGHLNWTHFALWQFFAFFLINSLLFDPVAATPEHFRAKAIETWSLSLLISVLLIVFLALQDKARLKAAVIHGLPAGLVLSFVIATAVYLGGAQGPRIHIATPNPLVPPLWFLMLTLVSFAWFTQMSRFQKALRAALFVMAGLMAVYGGARLVMLAWALSGLLIGAYLIACAPEGRRMQALLAAGGVFAVAAGLLWLADRLGGGFVSYRFEELWDLNLSYAELRARFPRLVLWDAARAVAGSHMPWGAGNINERALIQTEIGWDRWLRAHNSYLSFLIAGGPLALLSGLLLQAPALRFLRSETLRDLFPVFVGLGVVLTLNSLTDSILQSGVAVQAYMVILLVFGRAGQGAR